MRRVVLVVLVALVAIAAPTTADAAPARALNAKASGVVTGTGTVTSTFDFLGVQHFDLTIDTSRRRNSLLTMDVCIIHISFPPGGEIARFGVGTFALTVPSGATLTGTLTTGQGRTDVRFDLTVTSGTRHLRRVTGTLLLIGTAVASGTGVAAVTGTLTSNLTRNR